MTCVPWQSLFSFKQREACGSLSSETFPKKMKLADGVTMWISGAARSLPDTETVIKIVSVVFQKLPELIFCVSKIMWFPYSSFVVTTT